MKPTETGLKPKICYILPEFREETDSHFSYLYDFLNVVSQEADIFLIVEKGDPRADRFQDVSYIKRLHARLLLLRIVEELFVFIQARLLGYRIFYTHYSYSGALLSSLVARVSHGKAYYWNCGMPWLYGRQFPLRVVLCAVHVLVTGTVTMRELYAKEFRILPEKIMVNPNWIDLSTFRQEETKKSIRKELKLPLDRKIVLFVHRLSERKGADKILQIASSIIDSTALFVVIGEGPLFKEIQNTIKKENLEDRIMLLGTIPHKNIASYFFAADVFMMPSEEEGFPHVLLEAMAAGLPFVAMAVGGVRDIVPVVLQKYCVKSGDVGGFSERLSLLLKNEPKRIQISNMAREHVKKYDQRVVAKQFLSLF